MTQKSLFLDDQSFDHNGQELQIVKGLSSGLTGEVYQALLSQAGSKVDVVVKAMKALDFPLARQLFYKEGETLALLMHLEEETKDSLADGLKIAPTYYGLSEYKPDPESEGFPYIVMEFINGEQVPELLEKQERLSEKQALTITWHLYRMLDILHTRLLKTFIDLKFENLWWVENNSKWGGQLKLTDFGTLEEIKPGDEKRRGVARDILLGGVYLLAMLSGYTLEYSIGELKEHANPIIKRFEGNITWGTRRLLRKLLHRNMDSRFKNASDVLAELRQLANFWSQPSDRLADMAQKNLTLAENAAEQAKASKKPLSEAGMAAAGRAYSALDILRVTDSQHFDERDILRVENVLSIGDYFERGFALLQGRSFTLARQTFEEGMSWVEDPAVLRRWSYVARIGEEVPPKDFEERFDDLKKLLEYVNQYNPVSSMWQSARRDFADLANTALGKPSLGSQGLDYMIAECELFDTLASAEKSRADGQFGEASTFYEKAKSILENRIPPDVAKLIEEETGSLSSLRRNAEDHMDREKSLEQFRDAQNAMENGEPSQAVEFAVQAYRLDRSAPFRFEKLTNLSLTALEVGARQPDQMDLYIRASRQIADTGLAEFGRDIAFDKICNTITQLDLAIQNLPFSDYFGFCTILEEVYALLDEKGSLVEGVAAYAVNLVGRQPLFLNALADTIEKLIPSSPNPARWRDEASKVSEEQSVGHRKMVDDLLGQIHYILLPIMPDAQNSKTLAEILQSSAEHASILGGLDLLDLQSCLARLEQAKTLLDKADKIAGGENDYRRVEIDMLVQAVRDGLEAARAASTEQKRVQDAERRKRILALSEERVQLQEQLDWVKQGARWNLGSKSQISLYPQLREKLLDFLYRCYQTKAGDPEGLQESVQRQKILEEVGQDTVVIEPEALDVFVRWAKRSLDMLGGESWKQLSELAEERYGNIESEFKKANEEFEKGNLGLAEGTLDLTKTQWGATPEWQTLRANVAQASAWKSWWEARAEQFRSGKADADLLRDLRSFATLGLPALYWQTSPAGQYLDQAAKDLQLELQAAIKSANIYDEQFVETIRSSLNVAWTKRLSISSEERHEWKTAEWLRGAYSRRKDVNGLVEYINQTQPPENVEQALDSFNYLDWDDLHRAERQHREAQTNTRVRSQRFMLVSGIGLVVCLVLSVAGVVGYRANSERIIQILNGTFTPTPTLTITPTFTPTLTPTITFTPTETPTLTPVPQSRFMLQDPASVYPVPPLIGEAYWLINDTDAVLVPPRDAPEAVWKEGTSADKDAKGEPFVYTEVGNVGITWTMDLPFEFSGYYEIYILDTKQFSSQMRTFNILLDQQAVLPYRGTNEVIFQGAEQVADEWLSIGVYQINAGQNLTVQISLDQLTKDTPFAVDRLLIVRLNEPTRQMMDLLPSGRVLASMMDDPDAKFYEFTQGTNKTPVQDRGQFYNDVLAWNGSLSSRALIQPYPIPIWVEWTPVNRLAAGTYEVYVWIPSQHATVEAEYFLMVNGKVVERPNPALVNQKDHSGVWLTLGTWDLPEESLVGLRMVVAPGITGEIGVDAVAIVSVK